MSEVTHVFSLSRIILLNCACSYTWTVCKIDNFLLRFANYGLSLIEFCSLRKALSLTHHCQQLVNVYIFEALFTNLATYISWQNLSKLCSSSYSAPQHGHCQSYGEFETIIPYGSNLCMEINWPTRWFEMAICTYLVVCNLW